ncbi:Cadherin [Trinorchestia longiramus]|nr:Cadherin [Trinorchestia longiramus]
MDPATIFKIITNSTWIVTQLMNGESVQFRQKAYVVEVSEAASPGTILILQAASPYEGQSNVFFLFFLNYCKKFPTSGSQQHVGVLYKLSGDTDFSLFRVDALTGALQLLAPLDFETQTQHELTVIATSKNAKIGSNEAHVTVQVLDANDHSPSFALSRHETQITEEDNHNLPRPVYTVTARDGDKGKWGVLRYSISGHGTISANKLNNSTHSPSRKPQELSQTSTDVSSSIGHQILGATKILRKSRPENFGFENTLHKSPTAFTKGGNQHFGSPPLLDPGGVTVNNAAVASSNRSFPSLPADFLSENEQFGDTLVDGKEHLAAFTIDSTTGTISVMKPLDRDPPHGRATWRLVVTASDGELQADTEVVVNLKDINDNAPVFPTTEIEATVTENSPSGTPVVTIAAQDFDDENEGSNSKLIYSLQKNAVDEITGRAIFSVDVTTGSINTAMCCLDREHASHYGLTLVATDGGGLQGSCEILVLVADENDVPPRWGRAEWAVEVNEDLPLSNVLATLTVKDPDTHNRLAYRVAPNSGRGWDVVQIEGRPVGDGAELKSLVPLDFENPEFKDGLRFQVQVTDQGIDAWGDKYRVGEATVTVRIMDVNDNAPSFSSPYQTVILKEDAPLGTVVARVPAVDIDEDRNGLVSYSISGRRGQNPNFGIDHIGTIRIISKVDRETSGKHTLIVQARDHGNPALASSATVMVEVMDVNDNAPTFTGPTYLKVHKKDLAGFTSFFNLTDADDWSIGHGPPFTAYLDPRTPAKIKQAVNVFYKKDSSWGSGSIKVHRGLVMEAPSSFVVPVVTVDAGSPAMTATVSLTIAVISEDSPTTVRDITVVAVESEMNSGPAIPLGVVTSEGAGQAEYSWSKTHNFFSLNRTNGQLFAQAATPTGNYDLGIAIHEPPSPDVQASLSVVIEQAARHRILHSTPVDVTARLAQLIDTTQVAPNSGRGWDVVQIEGRPVGDGAELKSLVPLDFENPEFKDGLRFQVQVTDQGIDAWGDKYRVGEATVTVRIMDVNDNAPSFSSPYQTVILKEDAPLGTVVARVPAVDIDEDRNGLVSYSISGRRGQNPNFGIDHIGTIRIISKVDRETSGKHTLIVQARDHGNPALASSATVMVEVMDVNDNAPTFTGPTYLKVHKKDLAGFTSFFNLTDADDWSIGHGPPFTAYLDPRTPAKIKQAVNVFYKKDSSWGSGSIKVHRGLVMEAPSSFVVPVVTVDAGSPAMTATVSLTIAVISEDSPTTVRDITVVAVEVSCVIVLLMFSG